MKLLIWCLGRMGHCKSLSLEGMVLVIRGFLGGGGMEGEEEGGKDETGGEGVERGLDGGGDDDDGGDEIIEGVLSKMVESKAGVVVSAERKGIEDGLEIVGGIERGTMGGVGLEDVANGKTCSLKVTCLLTKME